MTANAFMRLAYWIMFQIFLNILYSRARKQVTSQQVTQWWTIVLCFHKILVQCCLVCCLGGRLLASGSNAFGILCHKCVKKKVYIRNPVKVDPK